MDDDDLEEMDTLGRMGVGTGPGANSATEPFSTPVGVSPDAVQEEFDVDSGGDVGR